jgi:hypothetical protein
MGFLDVGGSVAGIASNATQNDRAANHTECRRQNDHRWSERTDKRVTRRARLLYTVIAPLFNFLLFVGDLLSWPCSCSLKIHGG